jgi:hypothetical protein
VSGRAKIFKALAKGSNGRQLEDEFKVINRQNFEKYLNQLDSKVKEAKKIRSGKEITEKNQEWLQNFFHEVSNISTQSFDMFLDHEMKEVYRKEQNKLRGRKIERSKNDKKVTRFFQLLGDAYREIHYRSDPEGLSPEGMQWYDAMKPFREKLRALYKIDKENRLMDRKEFEEIERNTETHFILYFKLCGTSTKDAAFLRFEYSNLKLIRKVLTDIKKKGLVKG